MLIILSLIVLPVCLFSAYNKDSEAAENDEFPEDESVLSDGEKE